MAEDLRAELAELDRLSVAILQQRYKALFGRTARSTHRAFLRRRITWKVQEQRHGGLPDRASQRLAELAELLNPLAEAAARGRRRRSSGEARVQGHRRPNRRRPREIRLPKPGALIRRVYKGRELIVRVLDRAFEYDGRRFRSLSAIAKAVIAEAAKLFDAAGTTEPTGDESLSMQEQARLIRLLVDRVEYDGRTRQITIIFTDEASACVKASA